MKCQVFVLAKGFFRFYLLYLIPLLAIVADAKYPVRIDGSEIKYSPKLMGRSSVTYQGAMYVYGGKSSAGESLQYSDDMYKYTFDTENDIVSMSLVKQVNAGPNCTFCGAVMIDDHQMMILTHDYANVTDSQDPLTNTVVRPYIFDFTSLTWNLSISIPTYAAKAKNFRMRTKHTTVFHNQVIYTLGGADYYEDTDVALKTSWYYDIKTHSYGIVNNNRFDYRSIGGSSFSLSNNTIGSIYGKKIDPLQYNNGGSMMILDTNMKAWVENRTLFSANAPPRFEGVTAQVSRQKDGTANFAYFFGGYRLTSQSKSTDPEPRITFIINHSRGRVRILNLQNNTWLNVDTQHNEKDFNYVQPRSYASSALILDDKYFVVVSGESGRSDNTREVSDLDIVQLPTLQAENTFEENEKHHAEVVYAASILDEKHKSTSGTNGLTSTTTFFILIFLAVLAITSSICIISNVRNVKKLGLKKQILKIFLPQLFWYRRLGESFTTQVFRLIVRVGFIATFIGFIYYFVNDIINSSVSSTTQHIPKENVSFPDIRFCFTGWSSFERVPMLNCENRNALSGELGCSTIEKLNNNLFVPSFAEQSGKAYCYMYKSDSINNNGLNRASALLRFYTKGVYFDGDQRLRVQFYEPEKNPNRALYFKEEIKGLDAYAMDAWMDSEIVSGSTNNTVNQMVYLNMDSTVYVQFKIITTKQIDLDSLWNYVGIYPKYKNKTELFITHSESKRDSSYAIMPENATSDLILGATFVSPADFFDTVITEKRDTTIVSVLGVIGGIISILIFIQTVLFGTKPSAPWGLIQKSAFGANNRESKKRNLSKYFLTPEFKELPLETPVHPRFSGIFDRHMAYSDGSYWSRSSALEQYNEEAEPMNSVYNLTEEIVNAKNQSLDINATHDEVNSIDSLLERMNKLEARNQVLELVLKTYYIDEGIFRELQNIVNEEREHCIGQNDSSTPTIIKRSSVRRDSLF